jgi:hypothetical protein
MIRSPVPPISKSFVWRASQPAGLEEIPAFGNCPAPAGLEIGGAAGLEIRAKAGALNIDAPSQQQNWKTRLRRGGGGSIVPTSNGGRSANKP